VADASDAVRRAFYCDDFVELVGRAMDRVPATTAAYSGAAR
jgi:hypothetical protein